MIKLIKKIMNKNILILLIFIFLIFGLFVFLMSRFFPEMTDRGLFGDMFGSLNSLFSGLAFIGVVYTVFLQKKELGLQREELKLTRDELARSAEAQEKSEKILAKTARLNAYATLLNNLGNQQIAQSNKKKNKSWDDSFTVNHGLGVNLSNETDPIIKESDDLISIIKKIIRDIE